MGKRPALMKRMRKASARGIDKLATFKAVGMQQAMGVVWESISVKNGRESVTPARQPSLVSPIFLFPIVD